MIKQLKKKKMAEIPKNAKYTSPEIQNEVLHILEYIIHRNIIEEVKEGGKFSLIVDETKYVSKTEQTSIKYYHGDSAKESFLKFLPEDKLDAGSLTNAILSCLEKLGVDYRSNLAGQGLWWGISHEVMSGKNSGGATQIR